MIKVTYETYEEEKLEKPELTDISIFDNKYFVKYNIPNKAKSVVDQMRKDGRKGVYYSRGLMIQYFPNKSEEEILKIVELDIKNGVLVAEKKLKKKLEIKNIKIERK
jgi:hypothetical protein